MFYGTPLRRHNLTATSDLIILPMNKLLFDLAIGCNLSTQWKWLAYRSMISMHCDLHHKQRRRTSFRCPLHIIYRHRVIHLPEERHHAYHMLSYMVIHVPMERLHVIYRHKVIHKPEERLNVIYCHKVIHTPEERFHVIYRHKVIHTPEERFHVKYRHRVIQTPEERIPPIL